MAPYPLDFVFLKVFIFLSKLAGVAIYCFERLVLVLRLHCAEVLGLISTPSYSLT